MRVVVLARSVDQDGDEAPELVAADENPWPWREMELENFLGDACKLVWRDLENLVAREALQNVEQRATGMAFRREARAAQHFRDLLTEKGRLPCGKIISGRGKKPCDEETACYIAARAMKLDADRVHVDAAVYGGLAVRLENNDRGRIEEKSASVRRQAMVVRALAQNRDGIILEKPKVELRPWEKFAVLLVARIAEFTNAKKNKIAGREPAKECSRFGIGLGGRRRGNAFELFDGAIEPGRHRGKVGDDRSYIAKNARERRFYFGCGRLRAELSDLQMDETFARGAALQGTGGLERSKEAVGVALHFENRMSDKLRRKAKVTQRAKHRIEEKRHVVVGDVDRGELRPPREAMPESDLRLARFSLAKALESVAGDSCEIVYSVSFEFSGVDFIEEVLGEALGETVPGLARKGLDERRQFADAKGFRR